MNAEFRVLDIDTNISVANLKVSEGEITGTGDLSVTGAINWSGAIFYGAWTLTIPMGATCPLIDPTTTTPIDLGSTINNAGQIDWTSGLLQLTYTSFAGEINKLRHCV